MKMRINILSLGFLSMLVLLASCGDNSDTSGNRADTQTESSGTQNDQPAQDYMLDSAHYAALTYNPLTLNGGASSTESLVHLALKGLQKNDTALLQSLAITKDEYMDIVFPEQGMHWAGARDSRPEVREFLWENHFGSSVKGLRRTLRDLGGRKLTLRNIEFTGGEKKYISYTIHEATLLTVEDEQGKEHQIKAVGSIIEKDGTFKLMAWRDLD